MRCVMNQGKEIKVDQATSKGENMSSDLTPALPATAIRTTPCPTSTLDSSLSITSDPVEANKRDIGAVCPSSLPSVNFGLKKNHVVCLPLVSEHQKFLWTCSEPIQELNDVAYLTKAFNVFPYPTQTETVALAQTCSLHLDQVRVWFMVQRLRFGISWEPEEICEARRKMCRPNQIQEVDKEDMLSKMVPPLSHKCDGNTYPSISTLSNLSRLLSSPAHHKGHPVVEPNELNPPTPSLPLPQNSLYSVVTPTTGQQHLEIPVKVRKKFNISRKCHKHSHYELWQSFLRNSNPSDNELKRLEAITEFKMKYIRKWFCNRRFSVSLFHSISAKQEFENGQSQFNSSPTQLPKPRIDRKVRTSRKTKRASQEENVISNSNNDIKHQIRSSLQRRKEEKGLKAQHEKIRKKGGKQGGKRTSTRLMQLRENRENSQKHIVKQEQEVKKEEKAKEEQKDVGIANSQNRSKTCNKTKKQLELLKQFFLTCQWPTRADKLFLQQMTGLSCHVIGKWFGDTRYSFKQGKKNGWLTNQDRLKVLAQISLKKGKTLIHRTTPSMQPLGSGVHNANDGPGCDSSEAAV